MATTELTCEYIEKKAIFKITLEGSLDIDGVLATWEYIYRHNLIPQGTKRFLFDSRLAMCEEAIPQHQKVGKLYKKYAAVFKDARIAVVTRCPAIIVHTLHMQREFKSVLHERFQTIDAAVSWLMSDVEVKYAN
ncbi:MAG: hypothetical protein ACK5JS_04035 [Mangrovibacterium sp.]